MRRRSCLTTRCGFGAKNIGNCHNQNSPLPTKQKAARRRPLLGVWPTVRPRRPARSRHWAVPAHGAATPADHALAEHGGHWFQCTRHRSRASLPSGSAIRTCRRWSPPRTPILTAARDRDGRDAAMLDVVARKVACSEASCCSSGCKSRRHRSPVDVVVISSSGEGDRPAGSLEVKAPVGWACRSDPYRGRATRQAAANANQ